MQRDCPGRTDDSGQKTEDRSAPLSRARFPQGRGRRMSVFGSVAVPCLLSSVLYSAGGCQKTQNSAPAVATLRWAKVTLTVACPDGAPRLLFDRAGAAWARQTGATVRCVSPSP